LYSSTEQTDTQPTATNLNSPPLWRRFSKTPICRTVSYAHKNFHSG